MNKQGNFARLVFGIAAIGLLFIFSTISYGAYLEVKRKSAKVFASPKKGAEVIVTLKKGSKLTSIERKGMFWKVKTSAGKEGYVSVMYVKRKAGSKDKSIANAIRSVARDSRDMDDVKGARARTAVMGVRGLDESSETSYAGSTRPNMRMVYMMEDLKISQKKIDRLGDLVAKEIEKKMSVK